MGEVTAVPIGNGGKDPMSIFTGFKLDLSNARKIFADFVFVLGNGCSHPMIIHLLIKINVGFGPLALVRITGVKNSRAIGRPGCAAAAGWILNARDFVGQLPASFHLEKVQRSLFAATFGE